MEGQRCKCSISELQRVKNIVVFASEHNGAVVSKAQSGEKNDGPHQQGTKQNHRALNSKPPGHLLGSLSDSQQFQNNNVLIGRKPLIKLIWADFILAMQAPNEDCNTKETGGHNQVGVIFSYLQTKPRQKWCDSLL